MTKLFTKFRGIIALALCGVLIGTDFSIMHSTVKAVMIGIIITVIFVVITKLTGLEAG